MKNLCFDKDDILKNLFKTIYSPEEYFYFTYIKLLGLEDEIKTVSNAVIEATTFTNWCGVDYKFSNTKSGLKNYEFIEEEELLYLVNAPCLFGRKFKLECGPFLMNEDYLRSISS